MKHFIITILLSLLCVLPTMAQRQKVQNSHTQTCENYTLASLWAHIFRTWSSSIAVRRPSPSTMVPVSSRPLSWTRTAGTRASPSA